MTWTRRRFLGATSLGLLWGAVPQPLSALGRRAAHARPPAGAAEFEELRRNVGLFSSRGGTIGWLMNGGGTVVVDSQFPDTAQLCVDGLDTRGALPLDALINSHHHGDHTAGNPVFRGVAGRIVAHERVPELQRAAAGDGADSQVYADTTFSDEWTVEVGDESVRASHYGPAHTGGDATIFFERAEVVHMGDLVFNRLYPFIDRPGGASVTGWISLLESVAREHSDRTLFIFGHGRPGFGVTGDRADVLLQRDFLSALLDEAAQALAQGRSREEVLQADRLPGFPDHEPPSERLSLGAALAVAFDELGGDPA